MPEHPRRSAGVPEIPAGLTYLPRFVPEEEQDRLWQVFDGWSFGELRLRGQAAKRTARHFGVFYDVEHRGLGPAPPIPHGLEPLRERAAQAVGLVPADLAEALILRYPPGAGIGWHRDAPAFGAPVVGLSLGSACRLRFQRGVGDQRRVHVLELEPGSAYILDGPARWSWQHAIPATPGKRYSVTFRRLRHPEDHPGL